MVQEIQARLTVAIANGSMKESISPDQLNVDQSAIGRGGHIQLIGTTEETIDLGDISTEGYCYLQNVDEANYVEFGPQVGTGDATMLGRLKAGEFAWLRLSPGVTLRAKADTAPVKLDVRCFEN